MIDANAAPPAASSPTSAAATGNKRDKAMMLVATMARMAVGLLTFILLARYLGPVQFGVIATAMAYAGFVGIATDYGLNTSALRKASIAPDNAGTIVGSAMAVKALLTLAFAVVGGVALALWVPVDRMPIYLFVFVGVIANSFGDLALVAARAHRRFDVEAKLVVGSSIFMLVLVGGAAALTQNIFAAALAFMVTRIVYAGLILVVLRHWLGSPRHFHRSFSQMKTTLREGSSYAVDNILTTLSSQIDILLFGAVLTAHDIGIYQSGARLVQVIAPFAVVLSTVYLPGMAAAMAHGRDQEFRALSGRLTLEFTGLALVSGFGFAIVGPIVGAHLYGSRYDSLMPLWNGFAAFVILRFTASAYGIQLVALGNIKARIWSQLTSIGLFIVATAIVLPHAGLIATSWLLAFSALPSLLIMGFCLSRADNRHSTVPRSVIVILIVLAALVLVATGKW